MKPKVLVILGPTASGKSSLAVDLALQFNGEIISADSRQVYKGLDIGTGKITREEMHGVPHYMLDVADPRERYSVTEWKGGAEKAVQEILSRGKLPILCGGTGFYIDALLKNIELPDVPHNDKLQAELAEKTSIELIEILSKLDPDRATEIDPDNHRRVIRSIEIATALGHVPQFQARYRSDWNILVIGIQTPDESLREKIKTRLLARMDIGMVDEAIQLYKQLPEGAGLTYERMDELGLEYRYLAELLQNKLTKEKFIETLATKIWQYSRRQKTWFKRDTNIKWFDLSHKEALVETVAAFLSK